MTMLKRLTGADGRGLNLNISGEAVKGLLAAIWQDLRAKRLWPVALGLLVALVAVPVLLTKSAPPSAAHPPAPVLPPPVAGLPAVTQRLVSGAELERSRRDPFSPQKGAQPTTSSPTTSSFPSTGTPPSVAGGTGNAVTMGGTVTAAPPAPLGGSTTTAGSNPSGSSPASGGDGSGGSGSSDNGSPGNGSGGNGSGGHTPPPTGLSARQSYAVKLAITNSSGGINTVDPLQRLSVLPSLQHPLMVELGVLEGGDQVLFALEPGTVVSGPGQCIPGPINCQIVALARNRVEHLAVRSTTGLTPVALFAVTGISVVNHATLSGAEQARHTESPVGRSLLDQTHLSSLSLFRYQPSVGAVVDMRNLTFGVNK